MWNICIFAMGWRGVAALLGMVSRQLLALYEVDLNSPTVYYEDVHSPIEGNTH